MFNPQSVIRNSSSFLVLRRGASVAPLQAAVVMAGLLFWGGRSPTPFSSIKGGKGSKPSTEGGEVCRVHVGCKKLPVFVQRVVAAKIGCLFLFSGSSRRKSGVCFCSADRRGQNQGSVFVQRIVAAKIGGSVFVQRLVAAKIGCLFLFSGSSRSKSRVRICSAGCPS